MRNATLSQAGIAMLSLGFGAITGNLAYTSELEHSGSDTATHGTRYLIEKMGWNQHSKPIQFILKTSLIIPAGLLFHTSYKAGLDFYNNVIPERNLLINTVNVVGAISIASVNTYAENELVQVKEFSPASETSHTHSDADKVFSWATATGLAGEVAIGRGVSNMVTFVAGLLAGGHLLYEAIKPHKH
jgi:hypothetical protein